VPQTRPAQPASAPPDPAKPHTMDMSTSLSQGGGGLICKTDSSAGTNAYKR
jgi:hypothetical protein